MSTSPPRRDDPLRVRGRRTISERLDRRQPVGQPAGGGRDPRSGDDARRGPRGEPPEVVQVRGKVQFRVLGHVLRTRDAQDRPGIRWCSRSRRHGRSGRATPHR